MLEYESASNLGNSLKHGDEDELDEPDLRRGLGHLVSVHEGRHGQSLHLLAVRLQQLATLGLRHLCCRKQGYDTTA